MFFWHKFFLNFQKNYVHVFFVFFSGCTDVIVDELISIQEELFSICFFALVGEYCSIDCYNYIGNRHVLLNRCLENPKLTYSKNAEILLNECFKNICNF